MLVDSMSQSAESLLQLLQKFVTNPNQIQQIHALLVTNGHFFCKTQWKNTLLFNGLIRAHAASPHSRRIRANPLSLFTQMLAHDAPPNAHTFSSLLKALARHHTTSPGPPLHAQAAKRGVLADPFARTALLALLADAREVFDEMPHPLGDDLVECNALIAALCKNGRVGPAIRLFNGMPERDVVTWTSLVHGLRAALRFSEAVRVFSAMVLSSVRPNEATYVGLLGCCVGLDGYGGIGLGKQAHAHVIRTETRVPVFVATALINLYGKSGLPRAAKSVFDHQSVAKEVCLWNAMISAFGSNGEEREALALFDEMRALGLNPNEVTLVAVLTACARGKLVELGLELFASMPTKFSVEHVMEHYGCVVDMLGRAGMVREAMEFVAKMPIEPDSSVLGALLGACKIHGVVELGDEVGKRLIGLQGKHSGRYVVLSNINAAVQRWDRAAELRKMMVNGGVEKRKAYSLIS